MLHGIEFWRVGWKAVELDIFRDFEVFGNMGTGSIDDHHEKVVGVCGGDLQQKGTEGFGVHLGDLQQKGTEGFGVHFLGEHPVELAVEGVDSSINISELAFVAVVDEGAHGCGCPAAADSHHAAKASFVLKEDFHLSPADNFGLEDGSQVFREFFFQSS